MKFGWETEEEKLLRYIKIPHKKRLEWLRKMHEFTVKASSKRMLKLRRKLRHLGSVASMPPKNKE